VRARARTLGVREGAREGDAGWRADCVRACSRLLRAGKATQAYTEAGERSDVSVLDTLLGVLLKICPPNIVEANISEASSLWQIAIVNVLGHLFSMTPRRQPPR